MFHDALTTKTQYPLPNTFPIALDYQTQALLHTFKNASKVSGLSPLPACPPLVDYSVYRLNKIRNYSFLNGPNPVLRGPSAGYR